MTHLRLSFSFVIRRAVYRKRRGGGFEGAMETLHDLC